MRFANLPGIEVFQANEGELSEWDAPQAGWYWWACHPGCLPDGAPVGPFTSALEAVADCEGDMS